MEQNSPPIKNNVDLLERYTLLSAGKFISLETVDNKCEVLEAFDDLEFVCEFCSKSFRKSSNYQAHIRTHTGEKPFICCVCKKQFARADYLKTHLISHSGARPYSCNVCEKSFTHVSSLHTHMRIHTGERPYACDICPRSFTKSSDLQRHLDIHREKLFTCYMCDKRFARIISLKKHLKKSECDPNNNNNNLSLSSISFHDKTNNDMLSSSSLSSSQSLGRIDQNYKKKLRNISGSVKNDDGGGGDEDHDDDDGGGGGGDDDFKSNFTFKDNIFSKYLNENIISENENNNVANNSNYNDNNKNNDNNDHDDNDNNNHNNNNNNNSNHNNTSIKNDVINNDDNNNANITYAIDDGDDNDEVVNNYDGTRAATLNIDSSQLFTFTNQSKDNDVIGTVGDVMSTNNDGGDVVDMDSINRMNDNELLIGGDSLSNMLVEVISGNNNDDNNINNAFATNEHQQNFNNFTSNDNNNNGSYMNADISNHLIYIHNGNINNLSQQYLIPDSLQSFIIATNPNTSATPNQKYVVVSQQLQHVGDNVSNNSNVNNNNNIINNNNHNINGISEFRFTDANGEYELCDLPVTLNGDVLSLET